VSNQFPILIMIDEQGRIDWILDGNHRLHKAIQSQAKTIPAKLIRPSNLDDKAKKIFNIKEQGVAEDLTEVSADTLKNYKRASAGDVINRQNIANRTGKKDSKITKRNAGQELAQKKLDKKTQIDELDKSTLHSYAQKALDDKNYSKRTNRPANIVQSLRKIHAKNTQQTKLDEGYYGNRKMSYSDETPTVKMVIKHNRQLEETDQRFRYIEKIFLETSDGERFGVPTNKPSRARMFARHIAEGGQYKDERWSHLNEICEDLDKLGGFVRATHNKREQFNESAQQMIVEANEQYVKLREVAKKISGSKGYNQYFDTYEPKVINEDGGDLTEAFKSNSIDPRIESALPTLSKFGIKVGIIKESDMFAEWADLMVKETLDVHSPRQIEAIVELLNSELLVGPNAEVAIGELSDIIENDDLYDRLRNSARINPNSDARPQIIAWMQEQPHGKYRQILDKIKLGNGNIDEPQQQSIKKPQETKPQTDNEPSLNEDDAMLESIMRLLGK